MYRNKALLAVFLLGCDALWGSAIEPNPDYCGDDPTTCHSDEYCDSETKSCLPISETDGGTGADQSTVSDFVLGSGSDQSSGVQITSTSPASLMANVPPVFSAINGSGFQPGATVTLNGQTSAISPTFVNSTQLANGTWLTGFSAGVVTLKVQNPDLSNATIQIPVN